MSDILNKLKNKLAEAAKDFVSPEELRVSRLDICLNCENLIKITRQCSKCYCIVDSKVLIKKSKCPQGKW